MDTVARDAPFPEYTSGHSTFSSAAATVLAAFFGSDEIAFSTTSDAMPGCSRSFHSFSGAAAEAWISRIFGGIHFMSANRQGLASGARLGTYVSENFFKARPSIAAIERPKTEIVPDPTAPVIPNADPQPAAIPAAPPPAALPAPARRIVATGGQETSKGETP